jgi:AMMECR1 domain-containing protein
MGFLKKVKETRFQLARTALMRGVETGRRSPINALLTKDIYVAIQSWTPPRNWHADPNEKPRPLEF